MCPEDEVPVQQTLDASHERVAITLPNSKRPRIDMQLKRVGLVPGFGDDSEIKDSEKKSSSSGSVGRGHTTMDELIQEEEKKKHTIIQQQELQHRKDYWLHEGIIVRLINKDISTKQGSLFNEKGVVNRVIDRYCGEVSFNCGAVVRLDQQDLETVVPKVGGKVVVVNGAGRGCLATVLRINESSYNCDLRLEEGPLARMELLVPYEDFSKAATSQG